MTDASESAIERTKKALKKEKITDKRERPKSLILEQEKELRKKMQQTIDKKDELTYKQFK